MPMFYAFTMQTATAVSYRIHIISHLKKQGMLIFVSLKGAVIENSCSTMQYAAVPVSL